MKLAFALGDDNRDSGIADDVRDNAGHVQDTVDTCKERDCLERKIDSVEDDRQHDQTGARDAGCTDGSQNRCDHDHDLLRNGQVNTEDLGGEYDCDRLIDRRSVHVHDSAERDAEVCDLFTYAEVLGALEVQRDRCDTGACCKYEQDRLFHRLKELDRADAAVETDHETALYKYCKQEAGKIAGTDCLDVGQHDVHAVLAHDISHEAEYAVRSELENDVCDLFPCLCPGAEEVEDRSALVAELDEREAEKQSEEDNLQQVLRAQGVERVCRDDVHERVGNARDLFCIVRGGGLHDEACTDLHDVAEDKADCDGDCRAGEEEHEGLSADLTECLEILDVGSGADEESEDQRCDDHGQKTGEDRSEESDGAGFLTEDETCNDTECKTDHDSGEQA